AGGGAALLGEAATGRVEYCGRAPAALLDETLDRVGSPLAKSVAVEVDAAHPSGGREGDEFVLVLCELTLADPVFLREHDDRTAFGRLVGEGGELRHFAQLALLDAVGGDEFGRLAL